MRFRAMTGAAQGRQLCIDIYVGLRRKSRFTKRQRLGLRRQGVAFDDALCRVEIGCRRKR